jgi:phage protein D
MLDVTTKNATKFLVTFPQSNLDAVVTPTNIRVIQRPLSHDIAVMDIIGGERYRGLLGGAPVSIDWSNQSGSANFRGYVYRLDPHYEPGKYRTTVICVAASYPLMNMGQNVWVGVTAPDVVRSIAFQHGLDVDVDEHPRVYGQVAQAGKSYWQVLVQLAEETGYVLRVEGSTLVFRSRESLTAFFRPISPALDFVLSTSPTLRMHGEVQEFHIKAGSYNPEVGAYNASRSSSGVDPRTGALRASASDPTSYRVSDSPLFSEALVDRVINSTLEADVAVESAHEQNRFATSATMNTLGQPYFAPERMVYLRGLESAFTGYWTLRSVTHEISARNYRCAVEVGTDGLGSTLHITGEMAQSPASRASRAQVPSPIEGGIGWPYPHPVLEASVSIQGDPGRPLSDFVWTAPVRRWRTL